MRWTDLSIIILTELGASFLLGRLFIPYLRRLKTGKFDWYLGDRFRTDGSEPKMGGAVMAAAFLIGLAPSLASLASKEGLSIQVKAAAGAAVFVLSMMILGAVEDHYKDHRGERVVLGFGKKLFIELALSALLLVYLRFIGFAETTVLLPFRLGYMEFSYAYYPLTALYMAFVLGSFKLHDCFNGNTSESVGGLCACSGALAMLFAAACADMIDSPAAMCFCSCAAASCIGILIWTLHPSKLFIGESGALFTGACVCSAALLLKLELALIMLALPAVIDTVCAAAHYIIYKRTKKLLLKGAGLHAHLAAKGKGAYTIIILSSIASAVGGAAAVGFAVYSAKL